MISRKRKVCNEEFEDILFLSLDKKDYCIVQTQWKTSEPETYLGNVIQSNVSQFKGENIEFQVGGEGIYCYQINRQEFVRGENVSDNYYLNHIVSFLEA